MKIAVLGWGSLIWCPKNIKIKDKNWEEDGPKLPIEFARISSHERLTLVIYPRYLNQKNRWVQTLWTEMNVESIEEAILSLGQREGTSCRKIGFIYKRAKKLKEEFKDRDNFCKNTRQKDIEVSEGDYYYYFEKLEQKQDYEKQIIKEIEKWMKNKELDGVVWTELEPNFEEETEMKLTKENVIKYLKKTKAEEYIRMAPLKIRTKMRVVIEEKLGWVHEEN
ncbi:MAG: hypothetical protein ABEK36_00125 [Candidatus Aenigmatarchaeota archaeon]